MKTTTPSTECYTAKHLGKLVGKRIVAVARDGGGNGMDEVFGLKFDDGSIAWILCDAEGNGPGWLDVQK